MLNPTGIKIGTFTLSWSSVKRLVLLLLLFVFLLYCQCVLVVDATPSLTPVQIQTSNHMFSPVASATDLPLISESQNIALFGQRKHPLKSLLLKNR